TVIDEELAREARAEAEQLLERLDRLKRAHHAGDGAENAGLLATRDEIGRRRGGEEAAVAGVLAREIGLEGGKLAVEAEEGRRDERDAREIASVVHEVARREIVAAVDHEVVSGDERHHVLRLEPRLFGDDADLGIEGRERSRGTLDLGTADPVARMHDLALEIAELDLVIVDDAERAHAGGRKIEEHGRPEPARAYDEDLRA